MPWHSILCLHHSAFLISSPHSINILTCIYIYSGAVSALRYLPCLPRLLKERTTRMFNTLRIIAENLDLSSWVRVSATTVRPRGGGDQDHVNTASNTVTGNVGNTAMPGDTGSKGGANYEAQPFTVSEVRNAIGLSKLVAVICLVAHFAGCMFFLVANSLHVSLFIWVG